MLSRLLRGLAAVLLVLSMPLPFAAGQKEITVDRGVQVDSDDEDESSGSSSAVFPCFVLAIYAMLVLTIVCMPSRKA